MTHPIRHAAAIGWDEFGAEKSGRPQTRTQHNWTLEQRHCQRASQLMSAPVWAWDTAARLFICFNSFNTKDNEAQTQGGRGLSAQINHRL